MAGVCKPRAARELVHGAEAGGRPADPLPHPRHQRHRRRLGAGRGRGRLRRGRRRAGRDERPHLAAQPGLDRRRAGRQRRATPASTSAPCRRCRTTGKACAATTRRSRPTSAPAPPTSTPRDARRPVHQPARAGPRDGPRAPLARGLAGLCRRQPAVRRHRQGHADLEGGRRHGAVHGRQRPDAGRGARSGTRDRLPGIGGLAVQGRAGLPAGRLPGGAAEEGAQGRDAARRAGPATHCRRSTWRPSAPRPRRPSAARSATPTWPPT